MSGVQERRLGVESPEDGLASSWFYRMEARAKIVGIFAYVVVCALLTDERAVTAALLGAVILAGASGIRPRRFVAAYIAALPFVAVASVSIFLFTGVRNGVTMLERTSACVVSLLALALGTESFDLFVGLRRLRVPGLMTTLLMLTFRFIGLFSEELGRMRLARKARGFSGGRNLFDRYGLRVISYTAGMVLVRALSRAERVYDGLRGKGFRKDMADWRTTRFTTADLAFVSVLVSGAVLLGAFQLGAVP